MIRVLLVDDHELFREGLELLLTGLRDIAVVGQAGDGQEAVRLIAELKPDVVLMDISMPGMNGVTATTRVTKDYPPARVIVLSMHVDPSFVRQALAAGAAAYVLKGADRRELETAIRTVAAGGQYLSAAFGDAGHPARDVTAAPGLERLTTRQREVLQLLAEGNNVRAIAGRLKVSAKTIETHRSQIMQRLGIHDVPGLVRFAIRVGLVSSEA